MNNNNNISCLYSALVKENVFLNFFKLGYLSLKKKEQYALKLPLVALNSTMSYFPTLVAASRQWKRLVLWLREERLLHLLDKAEAARL